MPREAARKVITDAMVQKVKPAPKGKRLEYWDAVVPGFGLRVTDAGGKSFFLRTRYGSEQLRMSWRYPATSLETARALAKNALNDIALGIDPKARWVMEPEAKTQYLANTFRAIGERFMHQHVEPRLAPSTHREYRRVLFGKDTVSWANRPVSSITRADVRAVLDAMVERGSAGAANNTLAYLSKFFNWSARVVTRYALATKSVDPQPFGADAERIMVLAKDDLIYWPGMEPDKIFRVKQIIQDGRLIVWPARYGTGKKVAPRVQEIFPSINLNGEQGYKFSRAEGLRKAGIRQAAVSILGRLRVKELG